MLGLSAQLVALAMLSVVLLTVISETDDLQICHYPAEVERTCNRNDHHLAQAQSPQQLPVALALFAFYLLPSLQHAVAFLNADGPRPHQRSAHSRSLWSRPPPFA